MGQLPLAQIRAGCWPASLYGSGHLGPEWGGARWPAMVEEANDEKGRSITEAKREPGRPEPVALRLHLDPMDSLLSTIH